MKSLKTAPPGSAFEKAFFKRGADDLLWINCMNYFILIMEDSQQSGFSTPRRSAMVAAILARP